MTRRHVAPREAPAYDNRIHGRADYYAPVYDGEPDEDIDARGAVYDHIGKSPPAVVSYFFRAINRGLKHAPVAPKLPVIRRHGNGLYSVGYGAIELVAVNYSEDLVLTAFAEKRMRMDTPTLKAVSGATNVSRVMGDLATRYGGVFKPAIQLPGQKGRGGYYARVISVVVDEEEN